jgi:hypothetical protein
MVVFWFNAFDCKAVPCVRNLGLLLGGEFKVNVMNAKVPGRIGQGYCV